MKQVLMAALIVSVPVAAFATPYVPAETTPPLPASVGERHIAMSSPGPAALDYDPLVRYGMACDFIVTMQVADTASAYYGGMREGEHLMTVIQTDNTSESIWMWSHYYDLTGIDSYHDNIDAAWEYCMNFPAYDEEGDDSPISGYYRRYNCSWALRAEMEFRRVYGDTTYKAYAESCASYLCHNPMKLTIVVGMARRLNPMIMGWVVGNLYDYGRFVSDPVYMGKAVDMADSLKTKVEANPDRFHQKEWAMGGGVLMWGLVNSYFRENPAGVDTWVETYAPNMDTEVDSSQYQNAWRGWAALGQWTAATELGSSLYTGYFQHLADTLVANDGDLDGGIPVTDPEGDDRDQSWVTNYLGFMCLDRMLTDAGVGPVAVNSAGLNVRVLHSPVVDVPTLVFDLSETADLALDVYDVSGRRLTSEDLGSLPAGRHHVRWEAAREGGGVAPGVYFYRLSGTDRSATGKLIVLK
jgi:hypothetical protein